MNSETNATINTVLRHWSLEDVAIESRPAANPGLSKARVWRVRAGNEVFALRRISSDLADAKRATQTHRFMRYAARVLDYVPWPRSTEDGQTVAFVDGFFWSLETWAPGEPAQEITRPIVEMAVTSLWMLHEVTHDSQCFGAFAEEAPSKALRQRAEVLEGWPSAAIQPVFDGDQPEIAAACGQIVALLPAAVERVQGVVAAAADSQLRQQPIVGDLRREHVLFTGCRVTGLVDYGAARIDSPLVDLTRMLGELAGEDTELWRAGLNAYQVHRRLSDAEGRAIVALDAGGVVGACCRWLGWLADGTVSSTGLAAGPSTGLVAARLNQLAKRLKPISEGDLAAQRALAGETT